MDDWSSDDVSDAQISTVATSDSEVSQPAATAPRSRLRPAGSALAFVPFNDWEPNRSYEGEPTIRYNIEWKLSAKNRCQAGETELDVVISPRKFWKYVLQPKLTEASADKPWKEDKTKLVLSVTDRKTAKITKEYPKLDVKWSFIAQRLRDWSPFLNNGKKITIMLTFYYQALDPGKPGRGGATANQLADLEARTAGVGRSRRPLSHDDIPDEFRRLVKEDERQWEEREQKERERTQGRKRRRRGSDGSSAGPIVIHCHQGSSDDPPTPTMIFPTLSPSEIWPTSRRRGQGLQCLAAVSGEHRGTEEPLYNR
ncbi:hypothetical protein BFJ68_g17590 [Fusarium oxysporum]|uniref:Uncharacterized protein n=1 Tax=Fusarium oxysporum TaxID=5507 RepID=A0A420NND9_FUSOX|nr:hypothetical protein BFJ68_g17590 [Fusarium oxysporum]